MNVAEGDLLDQDVDVIVNAWNRNIIPWKHGAIPISVLICVSLLALDGE